MSNLEHQILIKWGAKLRKNDSNKCCPGHEQLELYLAAGDVKQNSATTLGRLDGEVDCDKVSP